MADTRLGDADGKEHARVLPVRRRRPGHSGIGRGSGERRLSREVSDKSLHELEPADRSPELHPLRRVRQHQLEDPLETAADLGRAGERTPQVELVADVIRHHHP